MTAITTPTRLGTGANTTGTINASGTGLGGSTGATVTTPTANRLVVAALVCIRDDDAADPPVLTPTGLGITWTELGTAGGIVMGGADRRRLQVFYGSTASPSGTTLSWTTGGDTTADGWMWSIMELDANVNPADAFVGSPYTLVDGSSVTTSTVTAWPATLASLENAGLVFWVRTMTETHTTGGTGWSAVGSSSHALATLGANQRNNTSYALGSNGHPGDPTLTGASGALAAAFAIEIKAIVVTADPSYGCVV